MLIASTHIIFGPNHLHWQIQCMTSAYPQFRKKKKKKKTAYSLAPSAHRSQPILLIFLLLSWHKPDDFLSFSSLSFVFLPLSWFFHPFEFFLHFVFCFSLFLDLSRLINSYLIFSIKLFNLLAFFFFFALMNCLFHFLYFLFCLLIANISQFLTEV